MLSENQTCTKPWLPFCVAFAPFPLRRLGPVLYGKPLFLWEVLLFLQDLLYESTVFSHQEIRGKRRREMVDLNSVHV